MSNRRCAKASLKYPSAMGLAFSSSFVVVVVVVDDVIVAGLHYQVTSGIFPVGTAYE